MKLPFCALYLAFSLSALAQQTSLGRIEFPPPARARRSNIFCKACYGCTALNTPMRARNSRLLANSSRPLPRLIGARL